MRPLLAARAVLPKIQYPVMVSPKLDGVRALVLDGVVMSRAMKPIPNKFVQKRFGLKRHNNLDGELIVGRPNALNAYRMTSSGVMSEDGVPDVTFWAFDWIHNFDIDFKTRYELLWKLWKSDKLTDSVKILQHKLIRSEDELLEYEKSSLESGFEGVMIRHMEGRYKQGRSTVNEGILLKLKRFEDAEAQIIEIIELQHNDNPVFKGELGQTKRTSHKAGRRGGKTMGSIRVRDVSTGVVFEIGTGFDQALRDLFWQNRTTYPGLLVKYKFFAGGIKDKPRFPVFLGFRDEGDM